jgi:hypothetical protein
MTRSFVLSWCVLSALTAGCGTAMTIDDDAGHATPDTGTTPIIDAGSDAGGGTDAFVPPVDTGPRADAGHDAAPAPDVGTVLPPVDAGDPFGDAGALGDPAWAPLTVLVDGTMCPALDPCGGDVVGTWDVSGGCFSADLSAIMMCPGARASGSGMGRGRVTFDASGIAHRVAQSEVDILVTVPAVCAGFVGGCSGIETRIRMATPDAACTTESDGSCLCQARQTRTIDDTDTYTISGNEIVGGTSGHHWAYCVSGSSLSYEDVTTGSMREPGIVDLTMR